MSSAGQGYFYSPEDQSSLDSNRRRQAYAQALMQQGQDPGTAQYGGLRSAGNSILGAFLAKRADAKQEELSKSAQDKYVQSMAALLRGQAKPATAAPAGPQEMDPEGNPMAPGQGTPGYQAAPQAPQQGQGGDDFTSRLLATGNPGLMAQFAPDIIKNQFTRENTMWERGLPMTEEAKQQAQLQADLTRGNAEFTNKLPMTAAQAAADRRAGMTLGETRRHNLAEEDVARNPFGTGAPGQAIAAGKTGDEFLATLPPGVAAQVKAIANYRQPAPGSRSKQSMAMMGAVNQYRPDYDATKYGAKNSARTAFAKGKQGDTVRSLNVAVQHLDQLGQLADAMGNNNVQAFNKIGNFFASQTGNPAPTNFNTAKQLVGDEIIKAIVGAGGGVADRQEAAHNISSASSPAQLRGVIQTYQGLLAGQLIGLRKQYQTATGLDDFEDFLADETKAKLESHGTGGAAPTAHTPTAEEAAAELARRRAKK